MSQNKDNSIIIVGGANQEYADEMPEDWEKAISEAKVLLMQREIPEKVNVEACKIAKKNGVITILDMGGNDVPLDPEMLKMIDYISPNETELVRVINSVKNDNLTESEKALVKDLDAKDPRITGFNIINILREFPDMKILFK